MSGPSAAGALRELSAQLRAEGTEISSRVRDSDAPAALGALAAAGPRTGAAAAEYALLLETVREGYLLHYGTPRVLAGHDDDLALLAGDYLYARGLERLAGLGDLDAVRELADLISLAAQCRAEGRAEVAEAAWAASAAAIGFGAVPAHERAKATARAGSPSAAPLLAAARAAAGREEVAAVLAVLSPRPSA